MKDLTEKIGGGYEPFKALLLYRAGTDEYYIESYDVDDNGGLVNVHPLSVSESQSLADSLGESGEFRAAYQRSRELYPENLLHIDRGNEGNVVWHSPAQKVGLFFRADLTIPEGEMYVPPLLWKAGQHALSLWALKSGKRPNMDTPLYHAPFFNIYDSGQVCLGSVKRNIPQKATLSEFMQLWERYFFDSSFSHTLFTGGAKGIGMVDLWKLQQQSGKPFPSKYLNRNKYTLKNIL